MVRVAPFFDSRCTEVVFQCAAVLVIFDYVHPLLDLDLDSVESLPLALFTSTDSTTAKSTCFRLLVDRDLTASTLEMPTLLLLSLSPEEELPSSHH